MDDIFFKNYHCAVHIEEFTNARVYKSQFWWKHELFQSFWVAMDLIRCPGGIGQNFWTPGSAQGAKFGAQREQSVNYVNWKMLSRPILIQLCSGLSNWWFFQTRLKSKFMYEIGKLLIFLDFWKKSKHANVIYGWTLITKHNGYMWKVISFYN